MDDACRERNEGAAAECSFHGDRCNFFSSATVLLHPPRSASRPPPPSLLVFSQSERASLAREMTYDIFLRGFLPGSALSGGSLCVSRRRRHLKKTRAPRTGYKKPAGGGPTREAGARTDNLHFSTINLTSRRCRFFLRARSKEFLPGPRRTSRDAFPVGDSASARAAFLKYRGDASPALVYGAERGSPDAFKYLRGRSRFAPDARLRNGRALSFYRGRTFRLRALFKSLFDARKQFSPLVREVKGIGPHQFPPLQRARGCTRRILEIAPRPTLL